MQQTFSHEFMEANCGCYTSAYLHRCSFMKEEVVTLKSIVESEICLKDKYWFVCKKLATKEENKQIAIRVAEIVLPIFEELKGAANQRSVKLACRYETILPRKTYPLMHYFQKG